jgi:hypothetical protein
MSREAAKIEFVKQTRRQWFRYSLRSLLLLITAIGLFTGTEVVPALRQKQAVAEVRSFGGSVLYDFEFNIKSGPIPPPPEPSWLVNLLSVDFLHSVVFLDTDSHFSRWPRDPGRLIRNVRFFPRLRQLQHTCEDGCDDDFRFLTGLHSLRVLSVGGAGVTDRGLQSLSGLMTLDTLQLNYGKLTDAGLCHLAGLANLENLGLEHNHISGAGLPQLAGLQSLRCIMLDDNPIDDAGLTAIPALPRLQAVGLNRTRITDASLDRLAKMMGLKAVCLAETLVSRDGVRKLRKMCPNLEITGSPE